MTKLIRTDLPEFIWDGLALLAREQGVTIGVYTKRLLIDHVENADPALPDPTELEWLALKGWLSDKPEKTTAIKEHKGRARRFAWARSNGFPA